MTGTAKRTTMRALAAVPGRAVLSGLLGITLAVALGACGGDADEPGDPSSSGATASPGPTAEPSLDETAEPSATVTGDGTGEPSPDDTSTGTTDSGGLPGEPFESGYLPEGAVLGVIGVAFDDVLNVRELPGARQSIVGRLDPLEDAVVSRGNERLLPGSIWAEVEYPDGAGWVNSRYLAHLGAVDDLTAEVVRRNEGEIPAAGSMEALGLLVAEILDYDDPQEGSRLVLSVEPSTGDLGEVTYDVVGIADDAQIGWRLHVFGASEDGADGFSLKTVEATTLCGRGVSDEGRCV